MLHSLENWEATCLNHLQHIRNVWAKLPSTPTHWGANTKQPCISPLPLHISYSIISKGNRRKQWTAGTGRCPWHIPYLELVEIASMILCQFNRREVISKLDLGCEPFEGRGLVILAMPGPSTLSGRVSQPQDGEFFVQGSCAVPWRMFTNIPALKLLGNRSNPSPGWANWKCPRTLPNVSWWEQLPNRCWLDM